MITKKTDGYDSKFLQEKEKSLKLVRMTLFVQQNVFSCNFCFALEHILLTATNENQTLCSYLISISGIHQYLQGLN